MGADSSDSVLSVGGYRRRGHGHASPLSKVGTTTFTYPPPLTPSPPLSQQNFEPYSILIQRSNIANCSQFLPIIAVLNAQLYHRMLLQYRYGEKEKERERGGDSSG